MNGRARLGHSTIQLTFDRHGHLFEGHDAALLAAPDATHEETRVSDPCPTPAITLWIRAPDPKKGNLNCGNAGADDGIRTRDPHLGKVMLYQLSHVRVQREGSKRLVSRTLVEIGLGASQAAHDRSEGLERVVAEHDVRRAPLLAPLGERVADLVDGSDERHS